MIKQVFRFFSLISVIFELICKSRFFTVKRVGAVVHRRSALCLFHVFYILGLLPLNDENEFQLPASVGGKKNDGSLCIIKTPSFARCIK